GAYGAGLAH
nr:Chain H, His Tag peptide [Escherichia coli]